MQLYKGSLLCRERAAHFGMCRAAPGREGRERRREGRSPPPPNVCLSTLRPEGTTGHGTQPDRDTHYSCKGRGRDDERSITTYDMTTGEQLAQAHYEFRPRRSLVAVSPDASKVYVGVAGSDFEVFDGKTLARLPSVELEGEIVGRIYVIDG